MLKVKTQKSPPTQRRNATHGGSAEAQSAKAENLKTTSQKAKVFPPLADQL